MNNLTLLTKHQILGENSLDVIKKYGLQAAVTDFCLLSGVFTFSGSYTKEVEDLKNRTGEWWTQSLYPNSSSVYIVTNDGKLYVIDCTSKITALRPTIPLSSIPVNSPTNLGFNGVEEIKYGEYPQTVAPESISDKLEKAYTHNQLQTIGKTYTLELQDDDNTNDDIKSKSCVEYEYNGKNIFALLPLLILIMKYYQMVDRYYQVKVFG